MHKTVINTAQIGFGYWGHNLARNIDAHAAFKLCYIVDSTPASRETAIKAHPNAQVLERTDTIFTDERVDAVVVATPASTHFNLCKTTLEAGKHCLVTNPITTTSNEARILGKLASEKDLILLIDHTFLYSPAVQAIKSSINDGEIGRPLYFESTRSGLGIFKTDANVVEDLAIHDLSIIDFLFDEKAESLCCQAFSNYEDLEPNLSYLTLRFPSGFVAHVTSHWLSPLRQRQIIIAGDKKMLYWDDTKTEDKLILTDCGIEFEIIEPIPGRAPVKYRDDGCTDVALNNEEPLTKELDDFYQAITCKVQPVSNVESAIRVMGSLEATQLSILGGGVITPLST